MPSAYTEGTQKICTGEKIGVRMRDALFAASRELNAVEWYPACKINEKEAFAFYTKSPQTGFHDGACPACIHAGILYKRDDGDWLSFSN
jgi:hypothetical protein